MFARIGLLGNPSDLYKGKVISVTIKNYYADVWIDDRDQGFVFEPNPELDLLKFQSFDTFVRQVQMFGYHAGGVALQKATAAEFFEYCYQHGIVVENRPFRLRYSSNIPRERGLSGSSAICCATLHCLMNFFDVDIPLDERAEVVLAAEKRIGILGGLQDRYARVVCGSQTLLHKVFGTTSFFFLNVYHLAVAPGTCPLLSDKFFHPLLLPCLVQSGSMLWRIALHGLF